jgi:hypothetical protein
MVAGIVAGQLGEQLAHIVAEIQLVDDELAGRAGRRIGCAIEPPAPRRVHRQALGDRARTRFASAASSAGVRVWDFVWAFARRRDA